MSDDAELGARAVARLSGVSTDTLRHYERKGLLPVPHRTAGGYRRYAPDAVARVRLIQHALAIGFSLDELARILAKRDRGGAPCHEVRRLVGERLADLDRHLEELTALRGELSALAREWDERLANIPRGTQAHLLDTLADKPGIERARKSRRTRLPAFISTKPS